MHTRGYIQLREQLLHLFGTIAPAYLHCATKLVLSKRSWCFGIAKDDIDIAACFCKTKLQVPVLTQKSCCCY